MLTYKKRIGIIATAVLLGACAASETPTTSDSGDTIVSSMNNTTAPTAVTPDTGLPVTTEPETTTEGSGTPAFGIWVGSLASGVQHIALTDGTPGLGEEACADGTACAEHHVTMIDDIGAADLILGLDAPVDDAGSQLVSVDIATGAETPVMLNQITVGGDGMRRSGQTGFFAQIFDRNLLIANPSGAPVANFDTTLNPVVDVRWTPDGRPVALTCPDTDLTTSQEGCALWMIDIPRQPFDPSIPGTVLDPTSNAQPDSVQLIATSGQTTWTALALIKDKPVVCQTAAEGAAVVLPEADARVHLAELAEPCMSLDFTADGTIGVLASDAGAVFLISQESDIPVKLTVVGNVVAIAH